MKTKADLQDIAQVLGLAIDSQERIFLHKPMLILTPIPNYAKILTSRACSINCIDDQQPQTMRTNPLHQQPQPVLQCWLTPTLVELHSPRISSILCLQHVTPYHGQLPRRWSLNRLQSWLLNSESSSILLIWPLRKRLCFILALQVH